MNEFKSLMTTFNYNVNSTVPEEQELEYCKGIEKVEAFLESCIGEIDEYWPEVFDTSIHCNKHEAGQSPDNRKVFVVHGRDGRLRDDFFSFLRSIDLKPIEWSEALQLTGKATPFIGDALESAFKHAQAVIVLLSPDDEVRLSPVLCKTNEDESEKNIALQARPNVLFEAGMAFGTHPKRTLLIEIGQVKPFSDVAGRHVVRLSDSPDKRHEIVERLRTAGCAVSTSGKDWLTTGDFEVARTIKNKSANSGHANLAEGNIIALLNGWWDKTNGQSSRDVTVNFNEVDRLLSLPTGSTKKYIGIIAKRKSFRCISSGDSVGSYEYDVSIDAFDNIF